MISIDRKAAGGPIYLSCRRNKPFTVIITPSRGQQVKVQLPMQCRRLDQSFLISYVDFDHTISQAAVIMPLEYASKDYIEEYEVDQFGSSTSDVLSDRHIECYQEIMNVVDVDNQPLPNLCIKKHPLQHESNEASSSSSSSEDMFSMLNSSSYPVLLSMHGSGTSASNHADAHKYMPATRSDYIFGVKGYIVIAPSRFGAHNWEGIGELSARHAILSLQSILDKNSPTVGLPRLRMEQGGVVSGHSMGGHGAWLSALNAPDLFNCLAPLAGL